VTLLGERRERQLAPALLVCPRRTPFATSLIR
jgi:hypothetical protein